MTARKDRLKKLVNVQEQLKALHETRHAGFLAAATKAEAEARDLIEHFDTESSMGGLFPEIYHRRITGALERRKQNLESASQEAKLVATATVRTNMIERAYRDVRRRDERERSDRERLDLITQKRQQDD
ncbi:hypothetical protein FJ987_10920 [Mesorhizobium sp. CU2]|uniref:hypothetical protein n=1 Tax=unclassified Mesorhizobium TaxID=325217 RepID=UPI00112D9616|nr:MULTISPECIES: hypothetical protein [unclassified Mesorhizobium]TPN82682.1 hypothetical protein FJ988_16165 [Mesorhizobium sp. CU3]TPO16443.1 hypothetical protein FJ987_10920 [Mesorhizobium sp. CU2]